MASRVVRPETTTLQISNDDWLLVKKRLNHGEQTDAFARRYLSEAEKGVRVNLTRVGMAKVVAYLVDWSLVGLDDKQMIIAAQPAEVVETFLNAIDEDSFSEISDAIDAHEAAMAAARDAEKNGKGGETKSSAISPSPVGVAGATSGSEN